MNLTINVTGATMDDIVSLFYRLGDATIEDVWQAEKVTALQGFINQGCSLLEALDRFDAQIHEEVEKREQEIAAQPNGQDIPAIQVNYMDTPVVPPMIEPTVETPPTLDPGYAEIPRIQGAQPANELHLDRAPTATAVPSPKPQAMNMDDKLRQVATMVVEKYGSKHLTDLLAPYEARSIMDLNAFHKEEFLNKLESELAA